MVQVHSARPIIAEQNIDGAIAVEITQHHALGGAAAGVERSGRWCDVPQPVVQVDPARLSIVADDNVEGTVAVDIA